MISGLIGVTVANRYSREIKDKSGKTVGRVSTIRSTANKKLPKRINYNMRQISARILKCKTSGSARMALTGARAKVAQLKRQVNDYGIDRYELEHAIIHATKIMRVAKKKLKHLQEEEASKKGGPCAGGQEDMEEKLEEELSEESKNVETAEGMDAQESEAEILRDLQQEIEREAMKAMQEEMQQMLEEAVEESGFDGLMEELGASFSADMDPEDLEAMKKKHRSEELKDILEADMKYLKAIFNRLQKEKEAGQSIAGAYANAMADTQGASLELGEMEIPVEASAPPEMAVTEGAHIDCMV